MTKRSHTVLALVVKTKPVRERDLMVTLLTQEQGKVLVVAKGVRQLCSHRRCHLETGNLVRAHLITTKDLPLLTQVELQAGVGEIRDNLGALKKFLLFMEILDRLLVSEELSPVIFRQILYLRELFLKRLGNHQIRPRFSELLQNLGYTDQPTSNISITNQVSSLLDQELHSFAYLTLKAC